MTPLEYLQREMDAIKDTPSYSVFVPGLSYAVDLLLLHEQEEEARVRKFEIVSDFLFTGYHTEELHEYRCCTEHKTHSNPHTGCILR